MKRIVAGALVLLLVCSMALAFAENSVDQETVRQVQQALNDAGYDCGTPDGIAGKKTRQAVSDYQNDHGLDVTGEIDEALLGALMPAADEHADSVIPDATVGGVTGKPDEPALADPEARYEAIFEEYNPLENALYIMADGANDEAEDIESHGALYVTEHLDFDEQGVPQTQQDLSFQDTPYGRAMIIRYWESYVAKAIQVEYNVYVVGGYIFYYDGISVETVKDPHDYNEKHLPWEYYHFPYSELLFLRGMRQDENGYVYFLINSSEEKMLEFVIADGFRIPQLRVYRPDGEGTQRLWCVNDYDVGPAWWIHPMVLDAMAEVLEPVEQ